MHIVITGTNRGIGLEFVRQYLTQGATIDTGVRHPDKAEALAGLAKDAGGRLRIFSCDTSNDAGVEAFAAAVGEKPVDLLVNNAGVIGTWGGYLDGNLDEAAHLYNTNTLGSIRMMRAFLPHLRRSSGRKIVNLSTSVASIADTTTDMYFGYRMSKAALNMATKVWSQMLAGEGFTLLAIHPGWVKTDMGGEQAPTTPEESVRGMIAQIDKRGPADTGTYLDFTGKAMAW